MLVTMTARYQVRTEGLDACLTAIKEFVAYIEANEPQTHLYVSMQEIEDATRFLHVFVFDDEAAQQRHASSEGVKRFTDTIYPLTLEPVVFTSHTLVAAKGLSGGNG